MALGKQGTFAKAPSNAPKAGNKNGGSVVGGGNVAKPVTVKPIAGSSKKPR